MKTLLMVISLLALGWLLAAAVLFVADVLDLEQAKGHMLIATAVWFVLTPIWIGREGPKPPPLPEGGASCD